jgi:hypothetical protein
MAPAKTRSLARSEVNRFLREKCLPVEPQESKVLFLGPTDDGRRLSLDPDYLRTQCLIIAPTQHGKSTLKRRLFRGLAGAVKRGEVTIFDSDPKGADHNAMVEDAAAFGLENMTYVLNSSKRGHVPCIRPWSGENPEQDAMDFLELGLSLFQDKNFLDTPQRYRWLYNASLPVIAQGGSLYDIAMMLSDTGGLTRSRFLGDFQHPLIQQDWEFYRDMTRSLRQQATQSAYVWCANLWSQPLLRHVFAPIPTALDLEEFVRRGGVFLEAIPEQRPLSRQSCAFLRSFLRHKFIKTGFRIPKEERPHLILFLDEAQLAMEQDAGVGLLDAVLNQGAGLNCSVILLCHTFGQIEKGNPGLLSSVLTNARLKIFGGGLNIPDMRTIAEAVFTESFDYLEVKFETWALQLIPRETTREQASFVEGFNEGYSEQFGHALAAALAHGLALSESESYGETDTEADAHTHGTNKTRTSNWQDTHNSSLSGSVNFPYNTYNPDFNLVDIATTDHWQLGHVTSTGGSAGEGASDADTYSTSRSVSRMFSRGLARSFMESVSRTASEQFGKNWGKTVQEARSIVPFYEYIEEERRSSRQYVSYEEHILRNMVKALSLRRGWFGLKPPYKPVRYFLTAWPESLRPPALDVSVMTMVSHPCYPVDPQTQVPPPLPTQSLVPEVLPRARTDDPQDFTEPSNEDFLEP